MGTQCGHEGQAWLSGLWSGCETRLEEKRFSLREGARVLRETGPEQQVLGTTALCGQPGPGAGGQPCEGSSEGGQVMPGEVSESLLISLAQPTGPSWALFGQTRALFELVLSAVPSYHTQCQTESLGQLVPASG